MLEWWAIDYDHECPFLGCGVAKSGYKAERAVVSDFDSFTLFFADFYVPMSYKMRTMTAPNGTLSKERILEVLQLLASRESQLEYRKEVPMADVSAELFCAWDDVFWVGDSTSREDFSDTQWNALLRFHSVFERILRLTPHSPLPPIEEFVRSPHWLQLSRAAARALHDINSPAD